nr:7TM GPCR domain containing protein [Haemonchus contortus]
MHLLRAPTFGLAFSTVLLLSIAIDRLLSLMSFYGTRIAYYRKLYLAAHILPAIIFGIIVTAVFFVYEGPDEYILCSFAIVMQGPADDFLNTSVLVICAVVILCYLLFICFLNKIRTSTNNVKNIYRSVLIVTLAVIFGYFAAAAAVVIGGGLNVERFYLNLFAGLIACFSISITFFVYYTISSEYREAFDDYLGIRQLKKMMSRNRIDANSSSMAISLVSSSMRGVR